MPNWCENEFAIAAKKDNTNIDTLSQYLDADDGFFEKLIPTPKELLDLGSPNLDETKGLEMMSKYGYADWYWWRVSNWGTKWDLHEINNLQITIEGEYKIITFACDTAWSPPEEGFQRISAMPEFRNVYFYAQYHEPGMAFEGFFSFVNGESRGAECVQSYVKLDDILADVEFYLGEIEQLDDSI